MDSQSAPSELPPGRTNILEKFQHTPLPSLPNFDGTFIRLINLRPAALATDPIVCDIRPSDLFERYTALSYSWATENGDDTPRHEIAISGMSKSIGTNLFVALTRLRLQDSPRLIWIDALCINQDDVPERNAQVRQMWEIYARAEEVVAWLGLGQPEVDEAFYRMLTCASNLQIDEEHEDEDHLWTAQARNTTTIASGLTLDAFEGENERKFCDILRERKVAQDGETITHEEAGALARTIYDFLNRRYFRRRWVVQELLHSHGNAILYWGSYSSPWRSVRENLLNVCNRLCSNAWDAMRGDFAVLNHTLGANGKHMLLVWWGNSLLHMLAHCDQFECSDDRDRIYSLAVLDKSENPFEILPDYHKTTREVYIEFSQQLVQKGHQSWLFSNRQVVPTNPRGEDLNLPSWVIDLRYQLDEPPERVRDKNYDIPFSIADDYVLTYCPYYFGTVLKAEHAPRHCWFTLLQVQMPLTLARKTLPSGKVPVINPFAFQALRTALENAQSQAMPDQDSRSDENTWMDDDTSLPQNLKSIENFGPLTLYHLYSGSPIFKGIQPGDLICGSLPDLRDIDNTVHVLKKKDDAEPDIYSLYRAWLVHDDMEPDRFLSIDVKATYKMKVRLA